MMRLCVRDELQDLKPYFYMVHIIKCTSQERECFLDQDDILRTCCRQLPFIMRHVASAGYPQSTGLALDVNIQKTNVITGYGFVFSRFDTVRSCPMQCNIRQ